MTNSFSLTSPIKRSTGALAGCYFKTGKLYHKTMLEKKPCLGGSFFNGLVSWWRWSKWPVQPQSPH